MQHHLRELLSAADVTLGSDVLDAIDAVVAPGTDLNPADTGWTSPALGTDARRRPARASSVTMSTSPAGGAEEGR